MTCRAVIADGHECTVAHMQVIVFMLLWKGRMSMVGHVVDYIISFTSVSSDKVVKQVRPW